LILPSKIRLLFYYFDIYPVLLFGLFTDRLVLDLICIFDEAILAAWNEIVIL